MKTENPGRGPLVLALQVATRCRGLPPASRLRLWARAALERPAQICVRIVGRTEGRALNHRYRGKQGPTNVLSFDYGTRNRMLAGDIVLCAPVIREEARALGRTLDAHYAHLTVHGLLHLQGHEHRTARQSRAMATLETAILDKLGYANPYPHE